MTATTTIPSTGEVVDRERAAQAWADLEAQSARAEREARRLMDESASLRVQQDEIGRALLDGARPGDLMGPLVVISGPRRNATVDRAACDAVLEVLADHGLVERIEQPAPPPVIRYAGVSRIRAHEAALAECGVRARDLIREGGPGEPVLALREAQP